MKRLKNLKNKGFTLIEMIVVIVIIAILAAIAIPAIMKYIDDAKETRYVASARVVYTDAQAYTVEMVKRYGVNKEMYKYANCSGESTQSPFDVMIINTFSCNAEKSADYGYDVELAGAHFDDSLSLISLSILFKEGDSYLAIVTIEANGEVTTKVY